MRGGGGWRLGGAAVVSYPSLAIKTVTTKEKEKRAGDTYFWAFVVVIPCVLSVVWPLYFFYARGGWITIDVFFSLPGSVEGENTLEGGGERLLCGCTALVWNQPLVIRLYRSKYICVDGLIRKPCCCDVFWTVLRKYDSHFCNFSGGGNHRGEYRKCRRR